MKIKIALSTTLLALSTWIGCGPPGENAEAPANSEEITVANCAESYGANVPNFYSKFFGCVDVSRGQGGTTISTDGLPPHKSGYYPSGNPNYVPFDDRGGTHYKNPGEIGVANFSMTVPDNPEPKGITINQAMVDNNMNTSAEEFSGGPVGIALDGVVIFAAMAAPGDDLADEQYTFDIYEGHPAGATYHYHFNTPGPLEVLVNRSISTNSTPGQASVELYGVMCDGTLVLGCTELDGSGADGQDFDAQNGHIHDITDGTDTFFKGRYHTHVCPSIWPEYPFFPEIAYYKTTNCR